MDADEFRGDPLAGIAVQNTSLDQRRSRELAARADSNEVLPPGHCSLNPPQRSQASRVMPLLRVEGDMGIEDFDKALSAWRAAHSPLRTKALATGADARKTKGKSLGQQKDAPQSICELERSNEPPKPA